MLDVRREAWRNSVRETALDPDLPIVDAHHHLIPVAHRPRLEPYLPADLFDDLRRSGHRIVATVHVDAFSNYRTDGPEQLRVVGETEYVERVAGEAAGQDAAIAGACAAIVGNADLMLGDGVGEILDAHMAASPRFRGVRRMTIYDPDLPAGIPGHLQPGVMLRPEFHDGMRQVERRQLSFDAGVVQSQLGEFLALVRAFPGTTFILGHIGTPLAIGRYADRRDEAFAEWRQGMRELAGCANVVVKIGGLNMAFTGLGAGDAADRPLSSEELALRQRDHVLTTIDLFGARRCMFESNFPVDKWYSSYTILWNSFKLMTRDFAPDERAALFHGTALGSYRIALPSAATTAGSSSEPAPIERAAGY